MAQEEETSPQEQTQKAIGDAKKTVGTVKTTVTTTRTAVKTVKAIAQAAKAVKTGVQAAATAAKATSPVGWAILAAQLAKKYIPKIRRAIGNIIKKVAKIAAVTSAALVLALGAKIIGAVSGLAFGAVTGLPLLAIPGGPFLYAGWTAGWGIYGFFNPAGVQSAITNTVTFAKNIGTIIQSSYTGITSIPASGAKLLGSAASGVGNFLTGVASGAWNGATGVVGGFFSKAGAFFAEFTSLSLPASTVSVPVFASVGTAFVGTLTVGIFTSLIFSTPQIDAATGEDIAENQYASISKTANPTSMTNEDAAAGTDVTYTVTLTAKAFALTNVTIGNNTTVSPTGSSSFTDFTTDKDGNDITIFDIGTVDAGTTKTITYTIFVQGNKYANSVITDTATASFTVDDKPSSISASSSVTIGDLIPPGSCGGLEIGFNTRGITNYGYGDALPFSRSSDVDADLKAISDMGGTVIRVFAAHDQTTNAEASRRLGVILDKAAAYNISVIVSFINLYGNGFRPQGTAKYYTDFWPLGGLLGAEFFSTGYKYEYLSFVQTIINDNKGKPNIYAWEPGNELKYDKNPFIFVSFMQDITSTIKSLDPSHPISTGMIGAWHTALTPAYLYPQLPDIDIISIHDYNGERRSTEDIDWANANGKKSIVGEIGFDGGGDRSPRMDTELAYWKSKNVAAVLQWGFIAKGLSDNGDGDVLSGMDTIWHTDYDQLASIFKNAAAKTAVPPPGATTPEQLQCYITQVAAGKIEPLSGDDLANVMKRVMEAESGGNQCAAGTAAEIGVFQYIAATWRSINGEIGVDSGSGTMAEYRARPPRSICWGIPGTDPTAIPPYDPDDLLFNWPLNCGGANKDCGAWDPYKQIDKTVIKFESHHCACQWTTYHILYPGICSDFRCR